MALLVLGGPLAPDLAGRSILLEAAAAFAKTRPWQHWRGVWRPDRTFDLEVKGPLEAFRSIVLLAGDDAPETKRGFYLFSTAADAERFVEAVEKARGEVAAPSGIHVLFSEGPAWAAALLEHAAGGPSAIPWALRTSEQGPEPCSAIDAYMLAATTLALTKQTRVQLATTLGPVTATLTPAHPARRGSSP